MWIERIHIRGFGCLQDRTYHFPKGRATLVLEDNESGKSTLTAAIIAGLCGFPKRKVQGEILKLKEVFRPWSGEAYSVEMDIEADGKRLQIERDFARDTFVIRERETNRDITAECSSDLAYHFLKLPREDFARVAVMSGKESSQFGSSTNIQARLSALVDGAQEGNEGDTAIAALEGARYSLNNGKPLKIESAIKRLNDAIAEKQTTLQTLHLNMETAAEDDAMLSEASERHSQLTVHLENLDNEYRAARHREVREQMALLVSNSEDVTQLQTELVELEAYSTFPAKRSTQLAKTVARIGERRTIAKNLEIKIDSIQRDASEIQARLDNAAIFTAIDSEDINLLRSCEDILKAAQGTHARKSEEVEIEKRALAAEGIDIEAVSKTQRCFDELTNAEREMLGAYTENRLRLETERLETEASLADCTAKLRSIKARRRSLRSIGWVCMAAGGACAMAAVMLLVMRIISIPPSAAAALVGVLVAAAGIVQITRASGLSADEKARIENVLEDRRSQADSVISRLNDDLMRLQAIATSQGFADAQSLLDSFKQYELASSRCDSLSSLIAQLTQAADSLESAETRALSVLGRLGVDCKPEENIVEVLARVRDNLTRYVSNRDRLRKLQMDIDNLTNELTQARSGIEEEQKVAQSILDDAGIDPAMPFDEAIRKFDEGEKLFRRYREIKDSLLPAALKHVVSNEALEKLQTEEAEFAGAEGDSDRSSSDVESERRNIRSQLDEAAAEMRELERAVGVRVDAYRRDYRTLSEELDELEQALGKATRFGEAIRAATDVMREVSQQSRRRWASALNERASAILPHLNGDYDTLLFDESLGFTIRHTSDKRIIEKTDVDACLSTGAKDQIYLAVRLACCGELSKTGESIPIILDDPLMATDDTRFKTGFTYLAQELSKDHQVIILSCHKSRHDEVCGEDVSVLAL